jgi:hypothetical protein
LNVLSQDLGRLNVTQDINRARQADQEFERKASALLSRQDSLLRSMGDTARKQMAELEAFKANHGLTYDAHYPTATGTFIRYAFLMLLVAVEGLLNASFFSHGLDTGLIGGFIQAFILAAANVIIAFLFGKFLVRYINHSNKSLKALGFIFLIIAFAVMGAAGLGIAHYRDSLTSEIGDPAMAALQALQTNTFNLRDFFSWALFAISVTFGLGALFDGLSSDDPYPGYGAISRRTKRAVDDYEDELNTLRIKLKELKDEELKTLDLTVQQSQSVVAVILSLIDNKRLAGSWLSTALRDADNSIEALLRMFRTENELHRNGVHRPAYFDFLPKLRPLQLPDFDTSTDEATLADQKKLLNVLLSEVQEVRARIQAAFNQKFDRLRPLDTHFPSREVQ